MLTFFVTMLATVSLNLTEAIIVGVLVSLVLFIRDSIKATVTVEPVDWIKAGMRPPFPPIDAKVVYVTGSLFFGTVNQLVNVLEVLPAADVLILSIRGVPIADISSVQAIERL